MRFLTNRTTPQPALHTGDICTETGSYIAGHCTPRFEREFQAGDQFTRCPHGDLTSWQMRSRRQLTKTNVSTFAALAFITMAALFLIWPQELGPESLQNAHVPFFYEARMQAHGLLLLFASQAMLIVIIITRQPRSILAVWAIISVAALPFAAELNRLDQGNPTQNLVVICSCTPIFIKLLGHVPTGKSPVATLALLGLYSLLGISVIAVVLNTRLGPILAVVFGQDVVEGIILFVIMGAWIVIVVTIFLLVGIARSRTISSQILPNIPTSTQSPPNR